MGGGSAVAAEAFISLRSAALWSWWNMDSWHIQSCHWFSDAIDIAAEKV